MSKLRERARRGKSDHVAHSTCPAISRRMKAESPPLPTLGDSLPDSRWYVVALVCVAAFVGLAVLVINPIFTM